MKTWKQINEELAAPLDLDRVQVRKQGGEVVPYLEGDEVIRTLNRIFDYDGWSSMAVSPIESTVVGKRINDKKEEVPLTLYLAMFQMEFWGYDEAGIPRCIRKADVGKNTAESATSSMHEMSASGAVTDALKRCCRQLGTQFGITLYDKNSPDFQEIQRRHGGRVTSSNKPVEKKSPPPAKKPVKAPEPVAQADPVKQPSPEPATPKGEPVVDNRSTMDRALDYVIPAKIEAGGSNVPIPFSEKTLREAVKSPVGYAVVRWLGGVDKSPAGLEPWKPTDEFGAKLQRACKYLADNYDEAVATAKNK